MPARAGAPEDIAGWSRNWAADVPELYRLLFLRRRMKNSAIAPAMRGIPSPTPTPMPAFCALVSPDVVDAGWPESVPANPEELGPLDVCVLADCLVEVAAPVVCCAWAEVTGEPVVPPPSPPAFVVEAPMDGFPPLVAGVCLALVLLLVLVILLVQPGTLNPLGHS